MVDKYEPLLSEDDKDVSRIHITEGGKFYIKAKEKYFDMEALFIALSSPFLSAEDIYRIEVNDAIERKGLNNRKQ
jgi:hypothetical protein